MSFNHTLTYNWSSDGAPPLTLPQKKTAGQELNVQEAIPNPSTDLLVALAITVAKLEGLVIVADQNLTLEFNNATTPAFTIALLANVPLVWQKDTYHANPLTANVTALYVTNASGAAATLKIRALIDPT